MQLSRLLRRKQTMVKGSKSEPVRGGGHTNHVLVGDDPRVLLKCKTGPRGACACCGGHRLELNKASYFASICDSFYAYAICADCGKQPGHRHRQAVTKRRCTEWRHPDAQGTDATLVEMTKAELSLTSRRIDKDKRKLKAHRELECHGWWLVPTSTPPIGAVLAFTC